MSSSGDGDKPAQTGLVDMGDISFYNNPYNPSFNLSEIAPYQGSFSEIVLNVTWAQLQPSEGGSLTTSAIDSAIAQVNALNASNGTNIGIKLRVWGGYTAPEWAKNIDGPPITVTGENEVDPGVFTPQTIGRFWTADYVDAWTSLQNALAARYDSNPVIRGISQTAGAAATDEPFVPLRTNALLQAGGTVNQVGQLQAGGYTDAAEMLTLRAAIADYSQWSTTPLDFTMNTFHLFDGGNELNDATLTLAVLQQARNSTRLVQPGNHALGNPLYAPDTVVYSQLAADAALNPAVAPNSFQTNSPSILGPYANWQATIANGVALDAGDIELWDFPVIPLPVGFTSFSPSQVQTLAAILAAGSPPPTAGAPDDGSALGFIAPPSRRVPRRGRLFGHQCSASRERHAAGQLQRHVEVDGGRHAGVRRSHRQRNRGDKRSGGDLVGHACRGEHGPRAPHRYAAIRHGRDPHRGDGQQRQHGCARCRRPGLAVLGSLLLGTNKRQPARDFGGCGGRHPCGWRCAGFDRHSRQSRYRRRRRLSTLLAALTPSAYSTASLTIGGTLEMLSGGATYFTGSLSAGAVTIDTGGAITGDGTLTAANGGAILNNGTIEAAADQTLGLQRLSVAERSLGHRRADHRRRCHVEARWCGASTQSITFAANSIAQLANDPYSPSTLALDQPDETLGTISGSSFADRLVLQGVTIMSASYAGSTSTVNLSTGGPLASRCRQPS